MDIRYAQAKAGPSGSGLSTPKRGAVNSFGRYHRSSSTAEGKSRNETKRNETTQERRLQELCGSRFIVLLFCCCRNARNVSFLERKAGASPLRVVDSRKFRRVGACFRREGVGRIGRGGGTYSAGHLLACRNRMNSHTSIFSPAPLPPPKKVNRYIEIYTLCIHIIGSRMYLSLDKIPSRV